MALVEPVTALPLISIFIEASEGRVADRTFRWFRGVDRGLSRSRKNRAFPFRLPPR